MKKIHSKRYILRFCFSREWRVESGDTMKCLNISFLFIYRFDALSWNNKNSTVLSIEMEKKIIGWNFTHIHLKILLPVLICNKMCLEQNLRNLRKNIHYKIKLTIQHWVAQKFLIDWMLIKRIKKLNWMENEVKDEMEFHKFLDWKKHKITCWKERINIWYIEID